jgi:hypothetical protein
MTKTHTAELYKNTDGRIVVEVSDEFDMVASFTVADGSRLVQRIDRGLKSRSLCRVSAWRNDGDSVKFDLYDLSVKASA